MQSVWERASAVDFGFVEVVDDVCLKVIGAGYLAVANMQAIFVTHNIFSAAAFGAHHPLSTARQSAVVDI